MMRKSLFWMGGMGRKEERLYMKTHVFVELET